MAVELVVPLFAFTSLSLRAGAQTALTTATTARDGTQQEFNDLQKLWESMRIKTESALQA